MDILIRGDGAHRSGPLRSGAPADSPDLESEFERIYAECTDPAFSSGANR